MGLESARERAQEAERILRWGFRNFANHDLLAESEVLGEAPVWLGTAAYVPLKVQEGAAPHPLACGL